MNMKFHRSGWTGIVVVELLEVVLTEQDRAIRVKDMSTVMLCMIDENEFLMVGREFPDLTNLQPGTVLVLEIINDSVFRIWTIDKELNSG